MKMFVISAVLATCLLIGCASEDTGQAPEGYVPTGKPAPAGAGMATPGVSPCQMCGKGVSKGELSKVDGKMVCQECKAAHSH